MSKRYRNNKKRFKSNNGIIVVLLFVLVLVGILGAVSKGFQEWNFEDWFKKDLTEEKSTVKEKLNLKTINLETTKTSSNALTKDTALVFANSSQQTALFTSVSFYDNFGTITYYIDKVYEDLGGLKFGSSSALGYISLDLINTYSFTHCLIKGRNYYSYNSTTEKYSSDFSGIAINEKDFQMFSTNEDDTTKMPPLEEKLFAFKTAQKVLSLNVTGKRCVIYEIVLWTEI